MIFDFFICNIVSLEKLIFLQYICIYMKNWYIYILSETRLHSPSSTVVHSKISFCTAYDVCQNVIENLRVPAALTIYVKIPAIILGCNRDPQLVRTAHCQLISCSIASWYYPVPRTSSTSWYCTVSEQAWNIHSAGHHLGCIPGMKAAGNYDTLYIVDLKGIRIVTGVISRRVRRREKIFAIKKKRGERETSWRWI